MPCVVVWWGKLGGTVATFVFKYVWLSATVGFATYPQENGYICKLIGIQ